MRSALFLVLLVMLSACSVLQRDADGVWMLESGTVDGQAITPHFGTPVVMDVASGAITGNAGCNDYGIEADVYAGTVKLYPDREITDLGCDSAIMNAEFTYWEALQRTSRYRVEDDVLQFEGNDVFLTFRRSR